MNHWSIVHYLLMFVQLVNIVISEELFMKIVWIFLFILTMAVKDVCLEKAE